MAISIGRGAHAALGLALFSALVFASLFMRDAPTPPKDPDYKNPHVPVDVRIEDLLNRMSLEEKVGQMALVEKNSIENIGDVTTYGIGAVLSGGGGKPEENTPDGWRRMVTEFSDAALATRLGIPLLYGVDANHGDGNVPGTTIFPHFIGLGAANDLDLVERVARATAEESRAMGIRWHFSPTLDLPKDIRWGRVYEAFSDDPTRTSELGAAYIHGLQNALGTRNSSHIDVLATAKHYIGLGSLIWGTAENEEYHIDQGVVPEDERALREEYLPPFAAAVEAGAMSVMAGLGSWGDEHISASRYLLTDVLKNELFFQGFVVSDWYGVYNISTSTRDSAVIAINAGVDMVMLPFEYETFITDVRGAVADGAISEERINDAVRRILRAKFHLGLFEQQPTQNTFDVIGSDEHRELAREAVRRSLVLLKNEGDVLPLPTNIRHVRVAGSAADNVGRQSGGWTVEWQGIDGNQLPGATSILSGIQDAVNEETIVEYDMNGNFSGSSTADVGIAIVGEKPYAEGAGDNPDPRLDEADLNAIANLKKSSDRVIVILVSGRPLIITDEISSWDALVMAWLPGSEGRGITDVLFGAVPFTGTLPLPWPRLIDQLPMTPDGHGRDGSPPLFPRGHGMDS